MKSLLFLLFFLFFCFFSPSFHSFFSIFSYSGVGNGRGVEKGNSFFSFFLPSFLRKENGNEKDNRDCLLEDNRKMQEHSSFRKMIFRKENAPFFRQKPRKIALILTFRRNFPEKIIFREFPEFFRRIFRKIRSKMKGVIMRPLKIKDIGPQILSA